MTVGLVVALWALPAWPAVVAAAEPLEVAEPAQRPRSSRFRRTPRGLPPEYRQIQSRSAVTRAELAVLLSVRIERMLEPAAHDRVVIVTDTRDHWADRWIQTVTRAGVMVPTPRHQFEPDQFLQRRELAEAISAVMLLAAGRDPVRTVLGRNRELRFTDMEPAHISYQAAAAAVSAGVLDVNRGGFFHPTALVSGAEVVDAVRRLERIMN